MNRIYHIDSTNTEEAAKTTIHIHRDTLISFRDTTPHRDELELEWEIRLYDYMLEDPVKRLQEYQDARMGKMKTPDDWHPPKAKREVVTELGWDVK